MSRQSGSQYRPNLLKRKRRSSDNCSNIENEPLNEEKKLKEDPQKVLPEEAVASASDDRIPLTELSVLRIASGKDRVEKNARSESERLPLFDSENESETQVANIELNPVNQSTLLCMTADEILAEEPLEPYDHCEVKIISSKPVYRRCFGSRKFPLPDLNWADCKILWDYLCKKDLEADQMRDSLVFERHPNLQPRMRAVLLEWIIEVCDVYKLHRETYYLAMDYLDRYLNCTVNIPKVQLQLIGITCLLIASKVEEIYPPKVSEFAYVTDGACSEEDIIKTELTVMKDLDWKCSVLTPNSWLCIYLQLCYKDSAKPGVEMIFPQYPCNLFSMIAQLLDLITLDIASLQYSYSVLAASCIYVVCSKHHALGVSGYKLSDIQDCINWIDGFWEALIEGKKLDPPSSNTKSLPPGPEKNSVVDFSHALQTHTVSLDLLQAAQSILEMRNDTSCLNLLTPPSSSKKNNPLKLSRDC